MRRIGRLFLFLVLVLIFFLKKKTLTFHVADAAITFVDFEVWGVEDLKGHFAAVAAAFVQHFFCTRAHDFMYALGQGLLDCKKRKRIIFVSNGIPFQLT